MVSAAPFLLIAIVTSQLWSSVSGATYIVHMDTSFMPAAFSSHQHWYDSLLSSEKFAAAAGNTTASAPTRLLYSYTTVMSGFTAVLSGAQLELLRNLSGFVSAYPDTAATTLTTHTYEYLGLNPVTGIWPASKYGSGVIIGVVDTGVWPESTSFRDDGMPRIPKRWKGKCESGTEFDASLCNRKLIGARYFNKGLLASDPNITISMNSSRDTGGHGTHTASTAAGNYARRASYFGYAPGTARGVAPRAHLAVYKALWEEGSVASDVLAAMDQAIADGVDVISLSVGYDRDSLYQDPIAVASFAAMEKGVVVSAAAGNWGPDFGSVLHGAPWMMVVGATTIDRKFSGIVTLGNGVSFAGSSVYIGNETITNVPLYYNQSIAACDSVENLVAVVKNKVVVCEFSGEENTVPQTQVLVQAKAAGGLFLTNVTLIMRARDYECPAAVLNPKDSAIVRKYAKNNKHPTVSMRFRKTFTGIKPAPTVAEFSSRGPFLGGSPILKPDVLAPGTLILAAYSPISPSGALHDIPLYANFTLLSGTSMSCPHASGLAALLKSVHLDWSPAMIRSAMMTTANLVDNTGAPIDGGASPLATGSGEIDPNKALDPGLVYDARRDDYVKYICALNLTREEFQTIVRNSSDYKKCKGGNIDLNYPSFLVILDYGQSLGVKRFKRTVTFVGDDCSAIYRANVTGLSGIKVSVNPPKLVFRKRYEKASFTLTLARKKPIENYSVVFGFLTWTDEQEQHAVRSPIAVSTITD